MNGLFTMSDQLYINSLATSLCKHKYTNYHIKYHELLVNLEICRTWLAIKDKKIIAILK